MTKRQSGPRDLPRLLRQERPRGRAVLAAGAAQRPDPDVHQRRHGAVQERLHRPGDAPLQARRDRAEVRARRRQAQRPRQRRLHRRGTTPSSRCWAISRSATTSRTRPSSSPGNLITKDFGLDPKAAAGHRLPRRRRGRRIWKKVAGFRRPDHPHRHLGQLLGDGRHRALRALLGDLLSTRATRSRAGRRAAPTRTATASWSSGTSSSCNTSSGPGTASICPSPPSTPAWAWSAWRDPAGRALELRHRPVQGPDRGLGAPPACPPEGEHQASHRVIADHLRASSAS